MRFGRANLGDAPTRTPIRAKLTGTYRMQCLGRVFDKRYERRLDYSLRAVLLTALCYGASHAYDSARNRSTRLTGGT
jgi:hypothetical protein